MSFGGIISTEGFEPSDKGFWDTLFDRFSRVIMPRALLVSAVFVAANWLSFHISCLVPPSVNPATLSTTYIENVCWMEGFYVFEEIGFDNLHGIYGIPTYIHHDGIYEDSGKTCATNLNGTIDKLCKPMEKSSYYQYQYMHFVFIAMYLVYSVPYMIIKLWNWEKVRLDEDSDDRSVTVEELITRYFSDDVNYWLFSNNTYGEHRTSFKLLIYLFPKVGTKRHFCNKLYYCLCLVFEVFVRTLVVAVNIVAFKFIDYCLNGSFIKYGYSWDRWGNEILPAYGICEVTEFIFSYSSSCETI